MDEALAAQKSERTPDRLGYRSGYYPRMLVTRVGKIELRVPQDRQGRFRTEVFERYQRSELALSADPRASVYACSTVRPLEAERGHGKAVSCESRFTPASAPRTRTRSMRTS